jgi:hypothetical protein
MEADTVMAIPPPAPGAVFEPEEMQALVVAFEEICREMNLSPSATVAREVVAIRVIDLAREGPIDPALLTGRVLGEVRMARQPLSDSEMTPPSMWPSAK